jgi:RNA polymerase sigma-70 factor (ECF subfamily)
MCRVRQGDDAAAMELVRTYEPEIRRAVRIRLTDVNLRRVLDSMDVCQSVFANYFVRAASGQFDFSEPGELIRLLIAMARNKVIDQTRRHQAGRRDMRRTDKSNAPIEDAIGKDATPSRIVSARELLAAARAQLSDDELYLADQRALGREWADLAQELGTNADAIRKKLTRALDRVSANLGFEESSNG